MSEWQRPAISNVLKRFAIIIVKQPMYRIIFSLLLLSTGCISTTAGMRATPIVDANGTGDVVAVGTVGIGYTIDARNAVNWEIDVGSSLESPLIVGETISYTHIGPKRGWRAGFGFDALILEDDALVRPRVLGQYLIPLRSSKSKSTSTRNEKFSLFDFRSTSYWTLGIGPEFSIDIREDDSTIAMGLGIELAWHGMMWDEN